MISSELVIKDIVRLDLPDRCPCGLPNLKIQGTRTNGRLKIEVRCMRCGKPLVVVDRDE